MFFRQSLHLVEKITYDFCFLTQFLQILKNKKLILIGLLAITLSLLGLAIFNSMLALLAI
jgi:hypothetical protein